MNFPPKIAQLFASGFGLGYAPIASGTWGSLPGLAVGAGLYNWSQLLIDRNPGSIFGSSFTSSLVVWLAIILLFAFAVVVVQVAERAWASHDDRRIVIDEIIGQTITVAFLPPTPANLLLGFFLFRVLDVVKPWPAGWIDKNMKGAIGTILDDVFAGAYAAVLLLLIHRYL